MIIPSVMITLNTQTVNLTFLLINQLSCTPSNSPFCSFLANMLTYISPPSILLHSLGNSSCLFFLSFLCFNLTASRHHVNITIYTGPSELGFSSFFALCDSFFFSVLFYGCLFFESLHKYQYSILYIFIFS